VLDLNSGKVLWEKGLLDLNAPATGSVFYAVDADLNLLALKASTGEQIWSKQTSTSLAGSDKPDVQGSLQLKQGTLYCYPATVATSRVPAS